MKLKIESRHQFWIVKATHEDRWSVYYFQSFGDAVYWLPEIAQEFLDGYDPYPTDPKYWSRFGAPRDFVKQELS